MKLVKTNIIILFITTILIAFSGCKSKKESLNSGGSLEKKSMKTLVEDVLEKELSYHTMEGKGKIELRKGNSSMKSSAVFKFVKDSIIQVSIRPIFGGEAMRVSLTPTEVLIIDRLNKQYALIGYNKIKSFGDLNSAFYNIQALLTNKLFIFGKQSVDVKDYGEFSLSSTPDVYMLQTGNATKDTSLSFAIDATDRIASALIYDTDKGFTVQWSYRDFVVDNNKSAYPTIMDIKADIAKMRLDMGIECSKYDIDNKNFKIDNSIPKKYTEANMLDIINKYMNMVK